jgi:plasmid stabilization system protein ParE
LQRHPTLYPLVFGNARRAVLRRFPYSVIYVVRDDELVIAACIHSGRDPIRWQKRL